MTRTARQKAIRAARQGANRSQPGKGCPTPLKRSYASEDAVTTALRKSRYVGKAVGIYQCPCGKWHIKTPKNQERK